MEKLLVMAVAAQLTEAAVGTNPTAISADLSDANVRARNLQAWETFRAYYAALIQCLADNQNWPPPQNISLGDLAGTALPGIVSALTPLLTGTGPLSGIVGSVLKLLAPPASVSGSIPAPSAAPLPAPGK